MPTGTGACLAEGPGLSTSGTLSGLDNPESVAVSPNGRSLYAVSRLSDALVRYKRDRDTGKLDYQYCFTGDTQMTVAGCEAIPEATSGGSGSGLDGLESVTVAPDGKSVYVTSRFDDSIFAFSRQPSGFISPVGCISGDTNTGNLGTGACTTIASATVGGDNSGLNDPKLKEVAISSDGEWLYAAGDFDDSVASFSRNPSTSALTYQGCVTGEVATGPAGTNACAAQPISLGSTASTPASTAPAGSSSRATGARSTSPPTTTTRSRISPGTRTPAPSPGTAASPGTPRRARRAAVPASSCRMRRTAALSPASTCREPLALNARHLVRIRRQ